MFVVFTINLLKGVGEERWRNDFPSEMENYSQTKLFVPKLAFLHE